MSTCKDCLHINVCKDYASYDKDSIISCDNFKNKADYAPVVRCKNCENCRDFNKFHKYCTEHSDGWGNSTVYVEDDDYCSFGIRKESEVRE